MQPNSSRRIVLGSITASVVASPLIFAGCTKSPIHLKIGVAVPLTGESAPLGRDLLNGVELAVDELNNESIRLQGRTLIFEIVAVDDKAEDATAKLVAQQLVASGVVAVIGHLNSGQSIAASPIYAEKSIAQLAISTNPKFTQSGLSTTFRLVANDLLQAKAIGSFSASQFSGSKYAVLDDGTVYGRDLADGAVAQLTIAKKNIVIKKSYDEKTVEFGDFAEKIKTEGVDVIVVTVSDFQVLALIEALKKINYTNISILGSDSIKTTTMLKAYGTVKGLYATSPILEAREFTGGIAFLDKYRAKFKQEPVYAGHYTYDAMHVLAAAIRRGESVKPQDIVATLKAIDGYAPVTNSMRWSVNGEPRYGVIGVYAVGPKVWELQMRSDVW